MTGAAGVYQLSVCLSSSPAPISRWREGGGVDALFFQRVLYIYLICIDSVQICQHMWWWANANLWLFINNITAVHSPIIFLQQSSRKSVFSVYYNFLRDVGAEFFLCPDEIPV